MKKTYKKMGFSHRKLLSVLLLGLLPALLCACGEKELPALPENDALVESQDLVAEKYNAAVQALETAVSHTMTGSVTSVAEIMPDGTQTVIVTTVECSYADGKMQIAGENDLSSHSTYFDGQRYYFTIGEGDSLFRYFTESNDYNDYSAKDYLLPVDSEIISDVSYTENGDGSVSLSFEIPFAIYNSPAMQGWLGVVVDETHDARSLGVAARINENGQFVEFSLSFVNDMAFGDETIHQEIVATMTLQDYSAAAVTAPADLSSYEDWAVEADPDDLDWAEDITPEDME